MTENIINSDSSLESYIAFLRVQYKQHGYLKVTTKNGKQRTPTQNAALHKFCELLATALNDAGFDFREFVKAGYAVPFTPELVKNHLWRPIQKAVTGKESTTKPETHEYSLIYDVLNVKLAEHGIHVPWPSKDSM